MEILFGIAGGKVTQVTGNSKKESYAEPTVREPSPESSRERLLDRLGEALRSRLLDRDLSLDLDLEWPFDLLRLRERDFEWLFSLRPLLVAAGDLLLDRGDLDRDTFALSADFERERECDRLRLLEADRR